MHRWRLSLVALIALAGLPALAGCLRSFDYGPNSTGPNTTLPNTTLPNTTLGPNSTFVPLSPNSTLSPTPNSTDLLDRE
jgi:hypothetical protein